MKSPSNTNRTYSIKSPNTPKLPDAVFDKEQAWIKGAFTRNSPTAPLYRHRLGEALKAMEYLISATPTGNTRNALTEANLTLMLLERIIQQNSER